jgi:autoinducer 2 (AI-2) kinase
VSLEELLARSDFISLHAAVTPASRGLIGAAELARARPGAFLINTARAALVDEAALAAALREGRLAGAAIDTFSVEPPGSSHPLLQLENVISAPHIGGNTRQVAIHQGRIVARALAALLAGERPRELLNPGALDGLDWSLPRREVDADTLARLRAAPGPAISDLQKGG